MRTIVAASLLAACAPSAAELRAPVDAELAQRLGSAAWPISADELATRLAQPLDAATATRIALAHSARLAAAFDELGIAGAELAAATSIGPTDVDVALRWGGGHSEHEVDVIQPVLGLIEMPRRRGAAHADLAAARATAEAAAIRLAARVDIALRDVRAAQQEVELRTTALDAAGVAATLRERMRAAGNTTELALARDRDAREQARIDVTHAQAELAAKRLRVDALLGVATAAAWSAAGRVEELPVDVPGELGELETAAVDASLALAAGRARIAAAGAMLGDARLRSVVPEVGVGASALDIDGTWELGPALRIGLPIFDWHAGARADAHARLAGAQHAMAADEVELRVTARAVIVEARAAYAEAKALHDTVLPLRQTILDETLAHYDAMDADPFALVRARREMVEAGHQYVDALRRFGNAMAEVAALWRGVAIAEGV